MPRYFFSIDDEPAPSSELAIELPNNAAALRRAADVQERIASRDPNKLVSVNIWNENGRRLGTVGADVLEVRTHD
jgi:hypothetical protein